MPWAWPAWGMASNARRIAATAKMNGSDQPAGSAALLTLVFCISIPQGVGADRAIRRESRTPMRPNSFVAVANFEQSGHFGLAKKSPRQARASLACVAGSVNDANLARWNQSRISGIVSAG